MLGSHASHVVLFSSMYEMDFRVVKEKELKQSEANINTRRLKHVRVKRLIKSINHVLYVRIE